MIVTCPNCATRYLVDDGAFAGTESRRVRCASCGNLWHHSPQLAAIQQAIAEATAGAEPEPASAAAAAETGSAPSARSALATQPLRAEPSLDMRPPPPGPSVMSRPAIAAELPAATRRRMIRLGGLGAIALLAALAILAIVGRDVVLAIWPAAAPVYSTLRLTEPLGAGLKVTVTPTRTPDSLVINGDIVNSADERRRVPKLRVTLRDGNQTDLSSKVIDPPVAELAPGAKTHFDTVFKHPSITATGVAVTFVRE